MKMQFTQFLKVSFLGLSFVSVLAACSKNDDPKSDDRVIKPTAPVEQSVDGFQTARIYKGAWRPTISCVSRENAKLKLSIDLWDHTLKYGGTTDVVGASNGTSTVEMPALTGQPLGTDRTWNLIGLPLELTGSSSATLTVDRYGHGFILARRSGLSCEKCADMVPKFDCEEATIPYEQKFVQAACDGDASFVDSFMTRYPNVPDYINQVGVLGETALTCALKNNRASVIETLLNQLNSGLDFSAGNLNGEMPLFIDMDGSAKYAPEWQRRSDVDLNRLDNRHRTILHTKTASNSTLRALLSSPRFSPGILSVENNVGTTGLGALVQRNFGSGGIEAMELAKTRVTINMERPAIEGATYLEYAVAMDSPQMAKYFLAEKPQQGFPNGGSPNNLVFIAAKSCDVSFVSLLDQRRDIDFAVTRNGSNAIDVARTYCGSYSLDAIVDAFSKRGVPDRLDPVVPACKGDVTGFKNSLSNGAQIGSKTGRVMQCIWNNPTMMQLLAQYPSAGWDWSSIETYATQAFASGNQNLVQLYLSQVPWPSSSGVYQRMRDAIANKQITVSQYYDALAARSALSDANLRMGPYNHLLFSLIADGDATRVSLYLNQVSASSWPSLDLSTQPAINDYYMAEYKDLLAADRCNIAPKLTESPLRFAMRAGQNAIAQTIASRMRADFGSQQFACNSSYGVQLMNVASLAIKQCQTGIIKQAYDIRTKYEGAGSNKFVRRSPWDVLARSKCTQDQIRALAGELLDTMGFGDDSSIVTDGANSSYVIGLLKDRGYKTQTILTQFAGSISYPAVMIVDRDSANSGDFRRTDGRVIAGDQYYLRKSGGSGTNMDYSLDSKNMISFAGIPDYVSFYYPDVYKKNGCLLIIDDGASLNMKDGSSLAIKKITVCKTSLRFKFDPTTSESATPIKNYVDGDFSYSLEGLDEATGTTGQD